VKALAEVRTWMAAIGGVAGAIYRAVLSHPSLVAAGVTPETLVAIWAGLLARAVALVGGPRLRPGESQLPGKKVVLSGRFRRTWFVARISTLVALNSR
jgi:hypothetical protein